MPGTTVYIGARVEPEIAKEFNELTLKRGQNKSFIVREWVRGYIQDKKSEQKNKQD